MSGGLRQFFIFCAAAFLLNGAVWSVRGADAETRAFTIAEKFWQDKQFDSAEKFFAEFVAKHPASPRLSQAVLLQAKSALAQRKFPVALNLLTTNMNGAAGIADQFQREIARVYEQGGKFAEAADAFALLVVRHTNSPLRLEAALGEAKARFQLRQWARVSDLLQNPAGVFAQAAGQRPDSDLVTDGRLLLGEALLEQRNYAAAENVVGSIPESALLGEARWRREFLRGKAQFGEQNLQEALTTSSNIVAAGAKTSKPALEAAGVALQGQILEALHRPAEAIAAYERNQRAGVPPERMREALFKTVKLAVAQGQITNAEARLKRFLQDHPNEESSDVALLTIAELDLQQYQALFHGTNGSGTNGFARGTNLLAEALANGRQVTEQLTNSPLIGQAYLISAWALAAQGNNAESLAAFRRAAEALPWSEDQAVARLKVAEFESQSGELTNALRNYRRVMGEYRSLPTVQNELVPRARYQMLLASFAARDLGSANEVIAPILREYPPTGFSERTLLLYGQVVDEMGKPARAREIFSNFLARVPDSSLRPEVELAMARSYERERDWPRAISNYETWLARFPTNANVPETELRRAVAYGLADDKTNSMKLLTNFIARFPTQPLAQRAQYIIGDLYFREGQWADAEREYQRVHQNANWPANSLTWESRLKAGRAALERQNFSDARVYLTFLIEDTGTPEYVRVQASFAWGDAYRKLAPTNLVEKSSGALGIYGQIPKFHSGSQWVPRAWGEIGICHFQLGALDNPTNYVAAQDAFNKALKHPLADASTRALARVGIGKVLWEQAKLAQTNGAPDQVLLKAARENFLLVLYESYETSDMPDPVWVRDAALYAAQISSDRDEWNTVLEVYQRLSEVLPALKPMLKNRIENARQKAALQGR
jgi:TolA-binding protein